jgi:hypothetical protein
MREEIDRKGFWSTLGILITASTLYAWLLLLAVKVGERNGYSIDLIATAFFAIPVIILMKSAIFPKR